MVRLPSHGAKERPEHLKIKDWKAGAALPFDWSQVKEDIVGNVPNLFNLTDRDQDGSSSCTCQTMGYGFKYTTGIEISREDVYSHIALPGGGAYLNAPLDYGINTGFAPSSKYPDPNPETEQAMTTIINVQVGDRIKTYQITYYFYGITIDEAAKAISEHDYIHLGIRGSWVKGWESSWVQPYYAQNDWQHALFAGKESVILKEGIPAIKAKSSWTEHTDPMGQRVYCHYLNKPYFDAGGIFEVIGVDIREIDMNETQVKAIQLLEGYQDPNGQQYWDNKPLKDYLIARITDKIKDLTEVLNELQQS